MSQLTREKQGDTNTHEFRLLAAAQKKVTWALDKNQKKIDKVKIERDRDYGPLLSVYDECFVSDIDKYTYKVCPMKDVRQDLTRLGTFAGWNGDYSGYAIGGGQACAGVADVDEKGRTVQKRRGGRVKLACGSTHRIRQVVENEPCVYEVTFETPAACGREEVERAVQELREGLERAGEGEWGGREGEPGVVLEKARKLLEGGK
jgi:hypothetical protein